MRGKNIFIAFILVVAVVAAVLLIKNRKVAPVLAPSASPSIQQQIENKFKGLAIPQDQERVELKDVSGGERDGACN